MAEQPTSPEASDRTTPSRLGPEIVRGFERAAQAFADGQTEQAALELEAVAKLCDAAQERGEQLTAEELRQASELHARCRQAASSTGDGLLTSMLESARMRSASNAYKSRP